MKSKNPEIALFYFMKVKTDMLLQDQITSVTMAREALQSPQYIPVLIAMKRLYLLSSAIKVCHTFAISRSRGDF